MDYILTLVLVVLAFYAGWHLRAVTMLFKISENPEHMIRLLEQVKKLNDEAKAQTEHGVPEDAVEMDIEQVNGVVYAYDKTTGEFLAQAQNIYQAATLAAKRFPGKTFWHPELKQYHQTT
jgi:division protein CdvB (Snf7/Vps24/ESCRT-III family)